MKRLFPIVLLTLASACAEAPADDAADELAALDPEYGKPLLGVVADDPKADSGTGIKGPRVTPGTPSEVWAVENAWADTDTPAARQAGLAWPENTGLSWDQKYRLWIRAMKKIPAESWGDTFELTTPWGTTFKAPALECAETSVFLRATFAAWHKLPFYISAWDGSRALHFGHFGVWRADGPDPRFASYKTRYADHRNLSKEEALANWPSDPKLAARKLTTRADDLNAWLGDDAYAGAYFDRIFLNKRVGHFLMVLLTYTGSMHLASHWNTFNIQPQATREGDTLLERWQKQGIGHTLVVKRVTPIEGTVENLDIELVSGSMPRRQAKWESPSSSKYTLTDEKTGGEGSSWGDDIPYAQLGGGMKRWRTPMVVSGRWYNQVPAADRAVWISHTDYEALKVRPATFERILGDLTPEQKLQAHLDRIDAKRQHLRQYPASCSARIGREEAFADLYALTSEKFGMSKEDTDRQYRLLEDYVFAELVYEQSRTCCWNSTNAQMFDVIMDYARGRLYDEATGTCNAPPVFRMEGGGYDAFKAHADATGLAASWVEWSADETCPQAATVTTDTLAETQPTPYCTLYPTPPQG